MLIDIKTVSKENGDLNLDIESVVEEIPVIRGATDDSAEQRAVSVALMPYVLEELKRQDSGRAKNDRVVLTMVVFHLLQMAYLCAISLYIITECTNK